MIRLRIVAARMGPSSAMKPVQTSAGASCNVCQLSIEKFRKSTDSEDNAPFCCDFYESFVAFVGEFLKDEQHTLTRTVSSMNDKEMGMIVYEPGNHRMS